MLAGSPLQLSRVTVLQREGELILIPPGWWHQTYHLEPTVAVAGQYLNSENEASVFGHIFDWCNVNPSSRRHFEDLTYESPQSKAASLFQIALKSKHGVEKGEILFKQLMTSGKTKEIHSTSQKFSQRKRESNHGLRKGRRNK